MKLTANTYLMKYLWLVLFMSKRSKVKVTRAIRSFCCVRSLVPCLFDRIMSYLAEIWPMKCRCVKPHFRVKQSKVKVPQVVRSYWFSAVFAMSALWIRAYWTDSIHMCIFCLLQKLLTPNFLQRLNSRDGSCCNKNLVLIFALKQSIGGISHGFTNIKSNRNMSGSD